jgi:hypothetical protein
VEESSVIAETVIAVVLWCSPIDSPFTIRIHEKYGPTTEWCDVNCVTLKDGLYYVNRRGRVRGVFSKENYAIERVD